MHQLLDEGPDIDFLEPCPRKLGVGASGFADVADQSIEPKNVIAGDFQKPLTQCRIFDPV